MKKTVSVLLTLCLVLCLAAGSVGCGATNMGTGEEAYPTYSDDKELMIGGWDSPIPTKENYQAAKDMGLTHIFLDQYYARMDSPQYETTLDWCEEIGLDTLLMTGFHTSEGGEWSDAEWDRLYEMAESPAADMICYWDEPYEDQFDKVKSMVDKHNAKYGADADAPTFYITLDPAARPTAGVSGLYSKYAEHVWDQILRHVEGKKFLSLDVYPLYSQNGVTGVANDWLPKMEVTANLAKAHDADFHMFIQSYWTDDNTTRRVTEADLSYQVYTCMAFGITGFSYFTYTESFLSGMTGGCVSRKDCTPTELYGWAKKLNTNLKKFDNVYLSFDWNGVYTVIGSENPTESNTAFGALTTALESLACASDVTATQDTVIGEFKDKDGNDGLMITNYSNPAENLSDEVNIKFKNANRALVYKDGERKIYALTNGVLDLQLGVGEGVFVIPVNV